MNSLCKNNDLRPVLCKGVCIKCYNKEYNINNPRPYRRSIMTEKQRSRSNERKQAWFERNKAQHYSTMKIWTKNNPGKANAKTAKRAAAKSQRTPKWLTEHDFIEIRKVYESAAEQTKNTGIRYEVDHIIPLRGKLISGLHVPSNLQIITYEENRKKSFKYDFMNKENE